METEQRPVQTVECEVLVAPKLGIRIEGWLRMHEEKKMVRTVTYRGKRDGCHLVTIAYTARGADLSDIMRPYRESKEWTRLADVIKTGKTRYFKEEA